MLYISGLSYIKVGDIFEPLYSIKYGVSRDLFTWDRPTDLVVEDPCQIDGATCFSHPCFVSIDRNDKKWLVLSCKRNISDYRSGNGAYKLVYSFTESLKKIPTFVDLNIISDDPNVFLNFSHMTCYPSLFKYKQKLYCIFNGNQFGRTGFGIGSVNINY